tara:strand:- start:180 stop:413 length:234 start_codon:yes stop_codon:yes gene_type:complete
MGMHKRYVSKENLIREYRDSGMAGVEKFLESADALIIMDDFTSTVVEYLGSEMINDSERWNEISRLISFESIKHGYS